jgi:hypothetical protein
LKNSHSTRCLSYLIDETTTDSDFCYNNALCSHSLLFIGDVVCFHYIEKDTK